MFTIYDKGKQIDITSIYLTEFMLPGKLGKMHKSIVTGFEQYVSRNNYLPVMKEGDAENFRFSVSKLYEEHKKDLTESFESGMGVRTSNFDAAWTHMKNDKGTKSTQISKLWNNKELILLATRGRRFGAHLRDSKLYNQTQLGFHLNKTVAGVSSFIL